MPFHEMEPTPIASEEIMVVQRSPSIRKELLASSEDYMFLLKKKKQGDSPREVTTYEEMNVLEPISDDELEVSDDPSLHEGLLSVSPEDFSTLLKAVVEQEPLKELPSISMDDMFGDLHLGFFDIENANPDFVESQELKKRKQSLLELTEKNGNKRQKKETKKSTKAHAIHKYQQDQWMDRYEKLVQFYAENGHCNVPYGYKDDPILAQWVKRQRHQYKRMFQGEQANFTKARVEILDSLGFVWDYHNIAWEQSYEQLKNFLRVYGHTRVPLKFKKGQLTNWLKKQRIQHKNLLQNKRSAMTSERLERLKELGVVFAPNLS